MEWDGGVGGRKGGREVILSSFLLQTSFWVVREIVKEENLRRRTEILTQFIRIAKV